MGLNLLFLFLCGKKQSKDFRFCESVLIRGEPDGMGAGGKTVTWSN
jgi:hypothetical protein